MRLLPLVLSRECLGKPRRVSFSISPPLIPARRYVDFADPAPRTTSIILVSTTNVQNGRNAVALHYRERKQPPQSQTSQAGRRTGFAVPVRPNSRGPKLLRSEVSLLYCPRERFTGSPSTCHRTFWPQLDKELGQPTGDDTLCRRHPFPYRTRKLNRRTRGDDCSHRSRCLCHLCCLLSFT